MASEVSTCVFYFSKTAKPRYKTDTKFQRLW